MPTPLRAGVRIVRVANAVSPVRAVHATSRSLRANVTRIADLCRSACRSPWPASGTADNRRIVRAAIRSPGAARRDSQRVAQVGSDRMSGSDIASSVPSRAEVRAAWTCGFPCCADGGEIDENVSAMKRSGAVCDQRIGIATAARGRGSGRMQRNESHARRVPGDGVRVRPRRSTGRRRVAAREARRRECGSGCDDRHRYRRRAGRLRRRLGRSCAGSVR